MISAILWKEWREHRLKYAAFWLALNIPILLVTLAVALSHGARAPFATLSNGSALKYLEVALLAESWLLCTLFLAITGFLAVSTFTAELEDGSVFYLYEQPVPPWKYAALKLLNGCLHTVLAASFAVLFAPLAGYALMLLGGKVTLAGSWGTVAALVAASARGAIWCSLISLIAFTGSALVSALLPRWWLATGASVLLVVLLIITGGNFFDFIAPTFEGVGQSTIGIGFGSSEWLNVSGETLAIKAFAPWRALPLFTAIGLAGALATVTAFIYTRKEVK